MSLKLSMLFPPQSLWEEEGIVRMLGRRIAEAPDGVGRHMRAHGCGLCTCKAHGRAVVRHNGR